VAEVGDHFVHEVMTTRKPNACFKCTLGIKIPHLLQAAEELGVDYIATGHHARVTRDGSTGLVRLRRAVEVDIDESHLLNGLRQRDLVRLMTPAGGLTRELMHRMADEIGMEGLMPPHSGKVCFIDHDNRGPMLEGRTTADTLATGMFRTMDGRIVGNHKGIHLYTIGQEVDLNLLNTKDRFAHYVLDFDTKTGVVVVGAQDELLKKEFLITEVNWLGPLDKIRPLDAHAKLGMRTQLQPCRVHHFINKTCRVEFEAAQHSVAPGEAITFYQGEEVMGGGWIFEILDETN
jgi:tRNA-specific 2-thiouridylase